jgi:glyoxylase-like metal-dependent hydrolase (beta-lactamase superfamily II)
VTEGQAGQGGVERPPRVSGSEALVEVADGVWILPDLHRTPHVPNIGIIVGDRSALVVDSGMGIANGERVLEIARELAGRRRLFVTATHFHPEHGYGVQAFADTATIVYNRAQRDELEEKQRHWTEYFSTFSPQIAEALEGVEYVPADVVYAVTAELDLGGRVVELHHYGPAHTRGDQVIFLPRERVLFTGDLVEERFFAIMPDEDTRANEWVERLERLEQLDARVVVPGHGALGDSDLVTTARECLVSVRDRVAELQAAGHPLEEIQAEVEPETLARYEDWDNRDWVGTLVRTFHDELPR